MTISFGQVIPVTGPNIGFPGTVSRLGERVITAREFVQQSATGTYNLNFGDPAVQVQNATGGYWTSVLDFITAAIANTSLVASQFAGMAVREVQTQLSYPVSVTPGTLQVGYYASTQMAEVLERGNGTVTLSVGAPNAGAQVYTRCVLNTAVTAGLIGDWETNPAATDLVTSVLPSGVINSTTLTLNATLAVYIGMVVSGPGIAPGAYIVSGTGSAGAYTALVLSAANVQTITAGSPIVFSNLIALPRVVVRTGLVDANGVCEITIKERNAA